MADTINKPSIISVFVVVIFITSSFFLTREQTDTRSFSIEDSEIPMIENDAFMQFVLAELQEFSISAHTQREELSYIPSTVLRFEVASYPSRNDLLNELVSLPNFNAEKGTLSFHNKTLTFSCVLKNIETENFVEIQCFSRARIP